VSPRSRSYDDRPRGERSRYEDEQRSGRRERSSRWAAESPRSKDVVQEDEEYARPARTDRRYPICGWCHSYWFDLQYACPAPPPQYYLHSNWQSGGMSIWALRVSGPDWRLLVWNQQFVAC
jgi:hypothetical protein